MAVGSVVTALVDFRQQHLHRGDALGPAPRELCAVISRAAWFRRHDVTRGQLNKTHPSLNPPETETQLLGDILDRDIGVVQGPDPVEQGLATSVAALPRQDLSLGLRHTELVTGERHHRVDVIFRNRRRRSPDRQT